MADISCAHCGEPWDVSGLRHEAVDYLDGPGADLTPLGSTVVTALERYRSGITGSTRSTGAAPSPYAQVVNIVVYQATLSGKGCPACGWTHAGVGAYRERQLAELVFGAVTDDDPAQFIDFA